MSDTDSIFRIHADSAAGPDQIEVFEFLRANWNSLIVPGRAESEKVLNRLIKMYSSKGRAYHNLNHVWSLISLADASRSLIQNYHTVCFAIWFHDAVYNPRRKDNEELSAEFAVDALNGCEIDRGIIESVREMVLATKEHRGARQTGDLEIFLDFDLSILGSPEEIYRKYSRAIRREYWWVPAPVYRRGRVKALRDFLDRDAIYRTEEMAREFEMQARRNIAKEVSALSVKVRF